MSPSTEKFSLDKELSWLSFNERVLQEAADSSVPLVERVRFLGIYSNNMDEFFRVRVAEVRRATLLSSLKDGRNYSRHLMAKIQTKVLVLQERFDAIYVELMRELARRNIFLINEQQLSEFHSQWLKNYFTDHLKRHITPLIIHKNSDLVKHINDDTTYLAVCFYTKEQRQYALVEVPTKNVERFVQLPPEKTKSRKYLILLDNIIRHCMDALFSPFFEYDSMDVYSMKFTRDADFDLNDELEQSQLEKLTKGLKQRLTAEPVRLVYDRDMPEHMLAMLTEQLNISNTECIIPGGRYHSFKDFIGFPNPGRKYLENPKISALDSVLFNRSHNYFEAIRQQDILLYYPYHKFSHFTELVRQAAYDPAVKFIKINLYRAAKKSRVIQSLIDAVKNGKQVTAVIELRARFDEQANIEWSRVLAEAGVRVHHGIPSLKIHSKLFLVGREEQGELKLYSHIGSGNFNESTAKIYTDISLFTANQDVGREVAQVFELIEHPYRRFDFNQLIVSPYNARSKLLELIDIEIKNAKAKRKAAITLKLNNLVDEMLVQKLYEASAAGVKIKLLIRGMCSLIPQIPGISDNISVISIVDRFLEHSRIMLFYAGGQNNLYLCSADWMARNIDNRVEVSVLIQDAQLKRMLMDILAIQFSDNTKARIINKDQSNPYRERGNRRKVRSQIAVYQYLVNYEKKCLQSLSQQTAETNS
ncbi:polyphosphate kinase 1 [Shewanella dokdonensis]|uniref:Polyphosphate kinase n=1 Tax=Shewanella dokdonensis TaxID=712036 RepID=A0ABX8DFW9_9GAMM|nr:polyphosphate kinase 1 [Shewanella dokdonensis]MCL1073349.1 polyphosphate kinase 1 [Shewanella dokdonensis]QVK22827.1 polyphosphate kinase 1 [Shewanella dokdonensis]